MTCANLFLEYPLLILSPLTLTLGLDRQNLPGESDPLHLNEVGLKLYFNRFEYALRCRHNLPLPKRSYSNVARSRQETVPPRSNPVSNRGKEWEECAYSKTKTELFFKQQK